MEQINRRLKMSKEKNLKNLYEIIRFDEDEDEHAFRILDGKFKDVVYKYNRFGVLEPEEGEEELKYRFEYDIMEIPEEIREKKYYDKEGKEFEEMIGDILIEVIQEKMIEMD